MKKNGIEREKNERLVDFMLDGITTMKNTGNGKQNNQKLELSRITILHEASINSASHKKKICDVETENAEHHHIAICNLQYAILRKGSLASAQRQKNPGRKNQTRYYSPHTQ